MLKELGTVLEDKVVEQAVEKKFTTGLKDSKTGKVILDGDAYVTIKITSEVPIRILKEAVRIDETFYLSERNARKLFGSSTAFLRYKGK